MTSLSIQSSAFAEGETIPTRYGYTEENSNPPLEIHGIPSETESLVLLVENPDPESSAADVWNHWLIWDIDPSVDEIPEGWNPEEATEGQNDFGEHGYGGPNPTNQTQSCRFRLYALDTHLGLPPSATRDDLVNAIVGTIIDKAQLEGTYTP